MTPTRAAALVLHQAIVLGAGVAFLSGVRAFSGRTLRGGHDPFGAVDAIVYSVLLAALVALTIRLYRNLTDSDSGSLGLKLTRRRVIAFGTGAVVAMAFRSWPWLLSIATGSAVIIDRVAAPRGLILGVFIAVSTAVFEEIASRAFPIRLFSGWPALRLTMLSATLFVLQHILDERLSVIAVLYLASIGTIFGAAYVMTGNIWLGAGLHAGFYYASVIPSGVTNLGAWYRVAGTMIIPSWLFDSLLIAMGLIALDIVRRRSAMTNEVT
ncbi:MAG: CPBP family intramembrane metalloprotease [Thermoanaerobaculia bacterium]|nr:CPBP family intramembrane metalloprotease [Thermoanaerobaculia bacterium]